MGGEISGEVDLFGDPVRLTNGRRGRPAHRWSLRNSNNVKRLLAFGKTHEFIADAIGCSQPILRREYFSELKSRHRMKARIYSRRLEVLWDLFEAGSVSAGKEFGRLQDRAELFELGDQPPPQDLQPPKPKVKLGKKELALMEADDAMQQSNWGDDLKFPDRAN